MKNFNRSAIAGVAILLVAGVDFRTRAAANPAAADAAASIWAEVQQTAVMPRPPAAWETQPPTGEQEEAFRMQTSLRPRWRRRKPAIIAPAFRTAPICWPPKRSNAKCGKPLTT